jgi:hypothetical protein
MDYLQIDGYTAYDSVAVRFNIMHAGCFGHARRRFFELIQALPRPEQKRETAAHEVARRIDALYAIERDIKAFTPKYVPPNDRKKPYRTCSTCTLWPPLRSSRCCHPG